MSELDPTSGDLDYLKVLGDIAQQLKNMNGNVIDAGRFIQTFYTLVGTLKLKNFGFYSVDTESSFPTPLTVPAFGYTIDTGLPYFYSPLYNSWTKIGLVLP